MPSSASNEHPLDVDVQKKMEDEHLRLMRQVRIIQTDRSHAVEGVHPLFRREDRLLTTLKKEYLDLRKNLKIATRGLHKKRDKNAKRELKKSIFHLIHTETKQDGGRTVINQLDELLQRYNKHMLNLRALVTARLGAIEERRSQSERRLVSTENKLENAMLRFNSVQFENQRIREEIEHMLKDRALFNQAWSRSLHLLATGKQFLSDLVESSTLAYDQRDEWCAKLRSLQEKGNMEQTMQVQEMQSLRKACDQDMKLYNFLATKGVTRVNKKAEQREIDSKKKKEEEVRNAYEYYSKILDDVQHYTNELDLDKVAANFQRTEQSNFSVYELMTSVCAEIAVIKHDLRRLRRDIADRKDWNEQKTSLQNKRINTLREELSTVKNRVEILRARLSTSTRWVDAAGTAICELFNMLGCSHEPFQRLLGDKKPSLRLSMHIGYGIAEMIRDLIEVVHYYERRGGPSMRAKSPDTHSRSRLKKYTIHTDMIDSCTVGPLKTKLPSDPCPACFESWWMFRMSETMETVFTKQDTLNAIASLKDDPAFDRSERIHPITDCKMQQSRNILAKRYVT